MTVKIDLIKPQTLDGTADAFSAHLPVGDAWQAKDLNGTNVNSLVKACSVPFNQVEQKVYELFQEFMIPDTTSLVREWETSVGLPSSCYTRTQTLEERRADILSRFRKTPIVTLQEVQDYINNLFPGVYLRLALGSEELSFEYDFPVIFSSGAVNDRFIIICYIKASEPYFEYDFEVDLTGYVDQSEILCVLRQVLPANVTVIFIEEPVI